jgi:hypothetical protein
MAYLILLFLAIDIYLNIKTLKKLNKSYIKPEAEIEVKQENDYTCFICQKEFTSINSYNKNRALCSEDCKRKYINGGFRE